MARDKGIWAQGKSKNWAEFRGLCHQGNKRGKNGHSSVNFGTREGKR